MVMLSAVLFSASRSRLLRVAASSSVLRETSASCTRGAAFLAVVWAGASNTGAAASADTGSRDSSILPVSRMLTMRLAFIGVRSFRVVFIRGSRYYKYTINWAKTKEILREWGLKLREWLKKGKTKTLLPGDVLF